MAHRAGARRTVELPTASHAAAVSQPDATARLILEAVAAPRERRGLTFEMETEMNVCNTHEIQVTVVSAGEAEYGTAELWSGGRMIGFTRLDDGDLMLRIDTAVEVSAHSLANAIAEANRLLALY